MPTEPTGTPTKRRILVIDDDYGMTTLCRRVLEETGDFVVKEENDGMSALETARSFRPHLIFLDRKLPGKDGPRIAAELSSDADLKAVPIVFLTGSVDHDGTLDGFPVMLKPITRAQLIQATTTRALPDDL